MPVLEELLQLIQDRRVLSRRQVDEGGQHGQGGGAIDPMEGFLDQAGRQLLPVELRRVDKCTAELLPLQETLSEKPVALFSFMPLART